MSIRPIYINGHFNPELTSEEMANPYDISDDEG